MTTHQGQIIQAHPDGDTTSIDLRMVVAPRDGRFHPAPPEVVTTEGEIVRAGDVIGHVIRSDDQEPVRAFCSGFLMGLLAEHDDLVRAGQPLAWIHPVES